MTFIFRLGTCLLLFLPLVFTFKHDYPKERNLVNKLKATDNNTAYLLPTNLQPSSYTLKLQPFLNNNTFNGWVNIRFGVVNATNSIVLSLDSNYIKLTSYVLTASKAVGITNVSMDNDHKQVTFSLNNTLAVKTNATLTITFTGILATDMLGFYVSTYNTSATQHNMAITQFEPTYARRAFPCFDEPAYRANFTVSILRLPQHNSLGNMPLDTSINSSESGWVLDTYKTTPAMPTYLVAFGVSDLANITNGTFRIFARTAALDDAQYLGTVGQTILDNIGYFTMVSYPLPKMDVVAVPDFDAGAMENWGLCTYREKYMLYNKTLNTWRSKYGVLSVNAHEFGHQWFGDLVTPAWWSYAWLNEAFATYFEYIIPNLVEPAWNVGSTEYIISAVQEALDSDTGSPRAMTSHVYSTKQIEDSFDYVIYQKGGSVLRMTENFLTTLVWRMGLNSYLNANQYRTGTPERLFAALQEAASGLSNVNETLEGWTTQPGYPLITVVNSDYRITNTTSITYTISQTPYALDVNTSYTWNVPVRYTSEWDREFNASKASLHWLLPSNSSTSSLTVNSSGWLILNVDQVGYYRVNYDEDNWIKLKAQLDSNLTVISAVNRAQLVDDALHLAYTGHLNYSSALDLAAYLVNETAPEPWNAFFNNYNFLLNQFYGTTTGNGLKSWARDLVTTAWANLTADLTTTVSTYQGSLTLLLASQFVCDIGLPECEVFAKTTFEMWRKNTSFIDVPEFKQAILCTGLRLDKSWGAFQDVWDYFRNSNNGIEQLMLINAMGCVSNETTIQWYLDSTCDVSNNYVRLQDRWVVFRAILTRQSGVSAGLDYIVNNYNATSNALGSDFSNVFDYLGNTISQQAHIDKVKSLVSNVSVAQALRDSLNSTVLAAIEKRVTWTHSTQAQQLLAWVSAVTSSVASCTINLTLIFTALLLATNMWQ